MSLTDWPVDANGIVRVCAGKMRCGGLAESGEKATRGRREDGGMDEGSGKREKGRPTECEIGSKRERRSR